MWQGKYPWGRLVLFIIVMFAFFTGCRKNDEDIPSNEVWMQYGDFKPSTVTVGPNTTVTWRNKDGLDHTVTSDDGLFNSGIINNNGTYSFAFDSTGTYQYHCTIHPGMTGVVVVN